jgi:hypothetical protein
MTDCPWKFITADHAWPVSMVSCATIGFCPPNGPTAVLGYHGLPLVLGAVGSIQKKAKSSCNRVEFTWETFCPRLPAPTEAPPAVAFMFTTEVSPTEAGVESDQRLSAGPTMPKELAGTLSSSGPSVMYEVSGRRLFFLHGAKLHRVRSLQIVSSIATEEADMSSDVAADVRLVEYG